MPRALMLAYVRNDYQLPNDLNGFLENNRWENMNTIGGPEICSRSGEISPAVYVTKHDRKWEYPEDKGGGHPGDISIRHLWLSAN